MQKTGEISFGKEILGQLRVLVSNFFMVTKCTNLPAGSLAGRQGSTTNTMFKSIRFKSLAGQMHNTLAPVRVLLFAY